MPRPEGHDFMREAAQRAWDDVARIKVMRVVHDKLWSMMGGITPRWEPLDQSLQQARHSYAHFLYQQENRVTNNLLMLTWVLDDETLRAKAITSALAWYAKDNTSIMHLLGEDSSYYDEDQKRFRAEIKAALEREMQPLVSLVKKKSVKKKAAKKAATKVTPRPARRPKSHRPSYPDDMWVSCSADADWSTSRSRHIIRKGGITTACGATSLDPETWVPNTKKVRCVACLQVSDVPPRKKR